MPFEWDFGVSLGNGEKRSARRGYRLGDGHVVHHCRSNRIFC
jgi:hypothetical protein